MASAVFFLDLKGKTLLARNYRGDIPMSAVEKFPMLLSEAEEESSAVPPCFSDEGINYLYIRHNNLYLLALTKRNTNAAEILLFLHKIVEVFTEYFKELEEESIRDNFVVIYELLDEMMDFGYPQTTESKILQEYITQESHKLEVQARPPIAVTNAVSWRSEGIRYRKNEVFLDVIESLNLLVSSSGNVLRSEILGAIKMKCYLSGMPELRLGLNDKVMFETTGRTTRGKAVEMEDVKFHQCVRLSRFENDRTISFIPPDGEFELMSYRLNTAVKPLIWVECVVESHSGSRIEYMLKAKAQFKRRSTANNVEIIIPVPDDADTPRFRTNIGSVHYAPEKSAIVWKIKQFGGGKEFLMRAELGLPSVKGDDERGGGMTGGFGGSMGGIVGEGKGKRPINVKFEIPYFTTSGIQVRYLKIIEPKLKQQLEQYMEDGREDRATSCDSKPDKSGAGAGAVSAAGNQRPYVDGNSPPRRRKVQSPREWESPREAMVEGPQYWPLQHEGISHSYERQTPFQWFSADAGTAADGIETGIGLDKVLQWLYSQVRDKLPVANFVSAHQPSGLRLRPVEESQPSTSTSTSTSFTTLVKRESHVPNRDLDSPTSQDRKRPLSAVSTPASQAFPPPTFFGASDHVIPDTKTSQAVSSTSTSTPTPTPNRPSSHATYSQTYESFPNQHRVSDSSNRHMAQHISLPQIELDDEPMACAIVSYLDLARSMLSEGASVHEVFGPRRPMVDLLFRSRRETDPHSVCYFACELTSGLEGMEPAARLGLTFMFISLIRWMILCSSANYDDIPELYRPTPMQISIPHSAAVEFCPFPHMRDALCRQYRDFLPVLAGNISCNWPYKFDMCVERLDGTGHVVLTDAFVRHVLVPENWTVKSAIFHTFPECRGLIKTSAPASA
ncbi:putative AP-1 adaptor complex subunit MU, partial [Aureobasidium melanogenum]